MDRRPAMYEKILVPLDGSELAEVALPYAEELAGKLGSEVILLHVCESAEAQYHHMHQLYIQKMVAATKRGAKKYLEKPDAEAIKVRSAILDGHPAEQIVDFAEEQGIDLIVIATHGWSGIRRWVMGSVADKVVRATKRPVALIRAKGVHHHVFEEGTMNKTLLPLDGSKESEAVIPYVEELASKLKGEVVLLHVVPPASPVYAIPGETAQLPYTQAEVELLKVDAESYLEKVANALKDKHIKVRSEVRVGNTAHEIVKLADEVHADLVAMSTHGWSGITRWALGSTADKVLNGGNTPLLLVSSPGVGTK
jgi:nucleotide-binding universal stress UspA family protein